MKCQENAGDGLQLSRDCEDGLYSAQGGSVGGRRDHGLGFKQKRLLTAGFSRSRQREMRFIGCPSFE